MAPAVVRWVSRTRPIGTGGLGLAGCKPSDHRSSVIRVSGLGRRSVFLVCVGLQACHSAPERPDRDAPPRPAPVSASASTPDDPVSAALPSAAPGTSSSGSLSGVWEGSYEARKGSVGLPTKVRDKGLATDDGKAASGPGTIEIFVLANGDVRGRGKGALGACTFTGRAEDGMVRATLMPDNPRDPEAMTGVLVGVLKGDVIRGEVQAAGPDATVVREAVVELKRRKK